MCNKCVAALPAESISEESCGESPDHAPRQVEGGGEGPQEGHCVLIDAAVARRVRVVVELLYQLHATINRTQRL